MIHEFARCPICNRGVLAVDDNGPTFVFDPHTKKGRPCPHLTLATVGFEAAPRWPEEGGVEQRGVWRWSRGEGLVGPDAQGDELGDYLTDLACDGLPWPKLVPEVPYDLVGVYASARESARKDGATSQPSRGEKVLKGCINGLALYSHRRQSCCATSASGSNVDAR